MTRGAQRDRDRLKAQARAAKNAKKSGSGKSAMTKRSDGMPKGLLLNGPLKKRRKRKAKWWASSEIMAQRIHTQE